MEAIYGVTSMQVELGLVKMGQLDKARKHGIIPVIPKIKNAKQPNLDFDSYLYKLHHLVENIFARLKHFRSIAT